MRQRLPRVVLLIIFISLAASFTLAQVPSPTIRETSLLITVTDSKGGFPPLQRELFSVYEKNLPLEI